MLDNFPQRSHLERILSYSGKPIMMVSREQRYYRRNTLHLVSRADS